MPEILKDERKVIRRDGKIIFVLNQEQEYPEEARENMIKEWEKELKEKEQWVEKFDVVLQAAKDMAEHELLGMKDKIEKDMEYIREALKVWSVVIEDN